MKTITTVREYQEVVDEVKKSKKPLQVKVKMTDDEIEKAQSELDLEGIEVIVGKDYDEIKVA